MKVITSKTTQYKKNVASNLPISSDVSVVITCHNYGKYLTECINSLLTQTVLPSEIIVVDDSSTDNTKEIVQKFGVKYIRCEHKSCFLSRKTGFMNANGSYLIFLDADDTLHEDYIKECLEIFKTNEKTAIVTTLIQCFDGSNEILNTVKRNLNQLNWIPSASVVRRIALEQSKAFEINELDDKICEDWFVWRKILNHRWYKWNAIRIEKPLFNYRKHNNSRSETNEQNDYYSRAGLKIEPISVFVLLSEIERLEKFILENQSRITELIILKDTDKNINLLNSKLNIQIFEIPNSKIDIKYLNMATFEYIFTLHKANSGIFDELLKKMDYFVAAVFDDYCSLIRKSSLEDFPSKNYELFKQKAKEKYYKIYESKAIKATLITPCLTVGGAEQWVKMLITLMDSSKVKWKVVLLNSTAFHPLMVEAILKHAEIYAVGNNLLEAKSFQNQKLAIEAATLDADVILTWGGDHAWPLPIKRPTIMAAHGSSDYTTNIMRDAYKGGANYFTSVSETSRDATTTKEMNATVIWNGVDCTRLVVNKKPDEIRNEVWKVPKGWWYSENKYVGYLGRLAVEKNVLTIARAVAELPYQFKCILIGDGISVDELKEKAKKILDDKLFYVPSVDDVGNHYNAFDVMVATSPAEGNSLTLIESMICGCPIVTTRTGAVNEFEKYAGTELFISLPDFPTANETAIAIRQAIKDGRTAQRVIEAQIFAKKHLTGEIMVNKWTEYLIEAAKIIKPV